jgi:hypothetical protein
MAVTYCVSPFGDDSHSGTSAQTAWQTIKKVNTIDLNPGDKVLFEGGHDYPGNLLLTTEDAGTPTQPVVIGSYGSGRARVKAGNGSGVTVRNAGGVVVENLVVTGDDYRTNVGSGIKIVTELPNNQKVHFIRINNVEASGFGRKKNPGYQTPNGCGIFVGGNASDESKSGYNDVRITRCVTYENEFYGILTTGCWQDNPDTYANRNVYVGYCRMYDNPGDPEYREIHSGSGILIEDVDGGLIEFCEAYNNGYACRASPGGSVGIWAAVANDVIIQHCESHHNRTARYDGGGFDFDGGTTNSTLQYNYSHDNDGAGFLICSYKNAPHTYNNNIVRYNISVNDSRKEIHGAINVVTEIEDPIRNTQIYGNTIYSSISSAISFQARKGICNTKVFNNLFVTANNQKLVDVEGNPDNSMATFAGNAYWAVDGKFDLAGYKSLEEWRAATGQEVLNGKPVGLVVDPKLIDIGNNVTIGDPAKLHTFKAYKLQKDSPLIDAGIDLRSRFGIDPGEKDFYGNHIPQGKGFDIGAHEIVLENTSSIQRK